MSSTHLEVEVQDGRHVRPLWKTLLKIKTL